MTLAVMLAIAAHVWPAAPCGQPQVQYVTQPPLQLEDSVPRPPAQLATKGCVVYVRRRDTAAERCTDVVHQWGHLDGLNHSSDPENVMYVTPRPYWRCTTKRGVHGFTRRAWLHPPTFLLQ